jgi:type III pantothenate kinase
MGNGTSALIAERGWDGMDESDKARMRLAIDVGNTRIKFGLLKHPAAAPRGLPECLGVHTVRTSDEIPWEELFVWIDALAPDPFDAIAASVNPARLKHLVAAWPTGLGQKPVVIDHADQLPLTVNVEAPDRVGIDRLLIAVAANSVRTEGRAAVVISSGTATTIDLISSTGAFEGGAILPGYDLCGRALHHETALLPLVEAFELQDDVSPLGKSTQAAIRSGLYWGQLGAVREIVSQLSRGLSAEPLLLLTGGAAPLLQAQLAPRAAHHPYLALQGLALLG